jgi:hypothetical protein
VVGHLTNAPSVNITNCLGAHSNDETDNNAVGSHRIFSQITVKEASDAHYSFRHDG